MSEIPTHVGGASFYVKVVQDIFHAALVTRTSARVLSPGYENNLMPGKAELLLHENIKIIHLTTRLLHVFQLHVTNVIETTIILP